MEALKGKVVFITGASSGIGAACTKAFAKLGAKLLLAARRIDRLELLQKSLTQEYQTEINIIQLDVRYQDQVAQAISSLSEKWREIDILVNN